MKKSILTLLAAPLLLLGACSSEEPVAGPQDGQVWFTVDLPAGMSTRAYSDGYTATHLQYAVYETNTEKDSQGNAKFGTYLFKGTAEFDKNELETLVSLSLVKGKTYDIVFWADKEGSPYTFDAETADLNVDYTGLKINDEGRDAFFTVIKALPVKEAANYKVKLYRPFAKINVGTDDIELAKTAGFRGTITSDLTVSNTYDKINLFSGKCDGKAKRTFAADVKVVEGEDTGVFPIKGDNGEKIYDYMSMCYVLTGVQVPETFNPSLDKGVKENHTQSETIDAEISFYNDGAFVNTVKIGNVPIQRNYRTNIFGSLLTSTVDFSVEKDPVFFDEDPGAYNLKYAVEQLKNEFGEYEASTPDEGKLVFEALREGIIRPDAQLSFGTDMTIDMNGEEWAPLPEFSGNIGDACTLTIKNLKIKGTKNVGLFSVLSGNGSIGNITLDGCTIEGEENVGAIAGVVKGNVDISWASATNCTVNGKNYVGGYVGRYEGTKNLLIAMYNNTVNGYNYVGGFAGYAAMAPGEIQGDNIVLNQVLGGEAAPAQNFFGLWCGQGADGVLQNPEHYDPDFAIVTINYADGTKETH